MPQRDLTPYYTAAANISGNFGYPGLFGGGSRAGGSGASSAFGGVGDMLGSGSQGTSGSVSSGTNQSTSTNKSLSSNQSTSSAAGGASNQSSSQNYSTSFIPEYSQTPILENIAKYAGNMAPQVYEWGMGQFNKNQGNIDGMMRDAMSYASPQRVAQEMGMAQSGVMQGAEQGRQNSMRELQSYGIDPSAGRYAALDSANRTMAGAVAAGAGNQQRMATEAAGGAMKNQAISASLQNVNTGFQAANAANQFAQTGMSLKYAPLGTVSSGTSQSTGDSWNTSDSQSTGTSESTGGSQSTGQTGSTSGSQNTSGSGMLGLMNQTSAPRYMAEGGHVPDEISKSGGGRVDDVPANLTAGEFIIPKDIVEWKGQEFFYKLMAQTRKMRATSGDMSGGEMGGQGQQAQLGYGAA